MQVISPETNELQSSRQAKALLSEFAFGTDAWPGQDREQAADDALAELAGDTVLRAGVDGDGWQWLMGYHPLEFDTRIFGQNMAALNILAHRRPWPNPEDISQGKEVLADLLDQAREDELKFISVKVPARDFMSAQVLEQRGFSLVDASVEWMLDLADLPGRQGLPGGFSIRTWQPDDKDILVRLAGDCMCELGSYADRFAMDPRLRSQCRQLYQRWVANSLEGKQADQVLVLCDVDEPAGLITLKLPKSNQGAQAGCGWVVINAIDPAHRGQGLYNGLLQRGLDWLSKHGATRARVRTKVSQQAVIRGFSRLGGRQVYADFTFHLWLDQVREQS